MIPLDQHPGILKGTPSEVRPNPVDFLLSSTIRNEFDGSVQSVADFIFGDLNSQLTYEQKRGFLNAVEGMWYRDNQGQDHVLSEFELILDGMDSIVDQRALANLQALCRWGLLQQLSEEQTHFAFTERGGVYIGNYLLIREFYEGNGRAKMSPNLSHKRVTIPSIPVSAKAFVQILKSIQRRVYEGQTGELLRFQDRNIHDYESITRVLYSFQSQYFFIDPALSVEIIPLGPTRIKVIAECYHILAEESLNVILNEISETWPKETVSEVSQGRVILRDKIAERFKLEEIEDLCFELGISYQNIGGRTLSEKARELVEYFYRQNALDKLVEACERKRPLVIWR